MADISRRSAQPNGGSQSLAQQQRGGGGLFSDLWGLDPFRNSLSSGWQGGGVEIERTEQGYRLEIPAPGFTSDQIDITFQDGVISVSGKSERRSFRRSIVLPDDIDADNIQARVDNGMLTLDLATVPEAQPRRIQIQSGGTQKQAGRESS